MHLILTSWDRLFVGVNCLSLVAHITQLTFRIENHRLISEMFLYIIYTVSYHMKQLCYSPSMEIYKFICFSIIWLLSINITHVKCCCSVFCWPDLQSYRTTLDLVLPVPVSINYYTISVVTGGLDINTFISSILMY